MSRMENVKNHLTAALNCDMIVGRMEENRSFFYAQNSIALRKERAALQRNLNGGGSRAHKDYTGMYRMQAAQLQHDEG